MDSEIIDAVTGWESVRVGEGYAGLRDLTDASFSGAVAAGRTWAFVLNGRVVGIFDGSLDDFEGADLQAYAAPDPALPLLYAMRERGGETRAKYYTNETPLSEADRTLSSANFTGYVELSENVLSGDYYVVYSGGKSMSAAFVGSSRRLITGDEAFERADDEVGIYQVREVDLELVEVPAPAGDDEGAAAGDDSSEEDAAETADEGGAAAGSGPTDEAGPAAGGVDDDVRIESGDVGATSPDATDAGVTSQEATDAEATDAETAPTDAPDEEGTDAEAAPTDAVEVDDDDAEPSPETDAATVDADDVVIVDFPNEAASEPDADPEPEGDLAGGTPADVASRDEGVPSAQGAPSTQEAPSAEESVTNAEAGGGTADRRPDAAARTAGEGAESESDVFSREARWRETRSIPALDPDDSAERKAEDSSARAERRRTGGDRASRERRSREAATKLRGLKQKLEAVTEERDRLRAQIEESESETERLRTERDELAERVETLEGTVSSLEAEIERLESDASDQTAPAERTMEAEEALAGTNLFIRFADKGEPTLEGAHAGRASRAEVNDNLRLEYHTTFETAGLAVDGRPFDEFLRGTAEYRFVRWIVEDLLYEIRNTGTGQALEELYDAIPRVDRVELRGSVPVEDAGEEGDSGRSFDVVLWDRMGEPLLVADLNPGRNAATRGMVATVASGAREVAETTDTLAAAFVVTASYFKPEALDVAAEETGGGLLGRNKRKAFVKLSRKRGFHLCLVEDRNDEFYVNYPDL